MFSPAWLQKQTAILSRERPHAARCSAAFGAATSGWLDQHWLLREVCPDTAKFRAPDKNNGAMFSRKSPAVLATPGAMAHGRLSPMSDRVDSTELRRDVQSLLAAASSIVDGYERHIAAGVAQVRALLSEAERWAEEGGNAPPVAQRYAQLAPAYSTACRCHLSGRCGVCKALKALAREFSTAIELEVAALTAFEWMSEQSQPNLEAALDDLADVLMRLTHNAHVTKSIMRSARAVHAARLVA